MERCVGRAHRKTEGRFESERKKEQVQDDEQGLLSSEHLGSRIKGPSVNFQGSVIHQPYCPAEGL